MSKPPDWWLKQREPRFGCADVTIVAVAAIAAFVILILILSRADFSTVLERIPFGNSATATPAPTPANPSGINTTDLTATALVVSAVTPIPTAGTRIVATTATTAIVTTPPPSPTAVLKPATIKTVCSLHSGDKPSVGTPSIQTVIGWHVNLDGKQDTADNFHWYEVVINDLNAGPYDQNKGWIVDSCLNLT